MKKNSSGLCLNVPMCTWNTKSSIYRSVLPHLIYSPFIKPMFSICIKVLNISLWAWRIVRPLNHHCGKTSCEEIHEAWRMSAVSGPEAAPDRTSRTSHTHTCTHTSLLLETLSLSPHVLCRIHLFTKESLSN